MKVLIKAFSDEVLIASTWSDVDAGSGAICVEVVVGGGHVQVAVSPHVPSKNEEDAPVLKLVPPDEGKN